MRIYSVTIGTEGLGPSSTYHPTLSSARKREADLAIGETASVSAHQVTPPAIEELCRLLAGDPVDRAAWLAPGELVDVIVGRPRRGVTP